jgi:uncharacterized protein YlzI (FlbEa/FlbD family)
MFFTAWPVRAAVGRTFSTGFKSKGGLGRTRQRQSQRRNLGLEAAMLSDGQSPQQFPIGPTGERFIKQFSGRAQGINEEPVMADSPSKDEVKFQIEASEARTDTKIERVNGKLDLVLEKISEVNDNYKTNRSNMLVGFFSVAGLLIALGGIIIAVWAAMPAFMDVGSKVREIAASEARAVSASAHKSEAPSKP